MSIDSRTIKPGQVFVAVRGDRFDGHHFLAQAAAAGAAMAIVDDPQINAAPMLPTWRVRSTVAALAALAGAQRDRLRDNGTKVIAVTGSNGKTTTRRLIHAVLSARFTGTQSPQSFNNHLGVPLTLLTANECGVDDFIVVEVGSNHPGEIATLGHIVRPDCAVITNVGHAHLGHFGDQVEIGREKAALLNFIEPGGLAVLPGHEELLASTDTTASNPELGDRPQHCPVSMGAQYLTEPLRRMKGRFKVQRFGIGEGSDVCATGIKVDHDAWQFTVNERQAMRLPLLGRHNISNALAAIAVGRWAGLALDEIADSLGRVEGPPMRLQQQLVGNRAHPVRIINDAYNANPDSVMAAIRALAEMPLADHGARRVLVLGDMLELGDAAADMHRWVGAQLAQWAHSGGTAPSAVIHVVVLIGKLSQYAAQEINRSWPQEALHAFGSWDDALGEHIAALLRPGDVVLIKASRAMALERIVPAIQKRYRA